MNGDPKCLDTVVILLGMWTILIQFFIYAGFNFDQLDAWTPALLIAILFFLSWLVFLQPKRLIYTKGILSQGDRSMNQILWLPLMGILAGVMLKHLLIVGVSAIVFLGSLAAWNRQFFFAEIESTSSYQPRFENSVLLAVMFVTVIITLFVNRSDPDDAYYLNASMATLRHSDLPLLSFNGIYGDSTHSIQQSDQRPQTYMILIALLSNWTGLSPRIIYYELFPPLWAALVPLAYFVVLKRFCPKTAWVALPVSMLMLLAWGDGHRVFGNFAFVRLFQAKAVPSYLPGPIVDSLRNRIHGETGVEDLVHALTVTMLCDRLVHHCSSYSYIGSFSVFACICRPGETACPFGIDRSEHFPLQWPNFALGP